MNTMYVVTVVVSRQGILCLRKIQLIALFQMQIYP